MQKALGIPDVPLPDKVPLQRTECVGYSMVEPWIPPALSSRAKVILTSLMEEPPPWGVSPPPPLDPGPITLHDATPGTGMPTFMTGHTLLLCHVSDGVGLGSPLWEHWMGDLPPAYPVPFYF